MANNLLRNLLQNLWLSEAKIRGVTLGRKVHCLGRPIFSVHKQSSLQVGDEVRFHSHPRSNPMGVPQPCVVRTIAAGAKLDIADRVGLSGAAVVCASNISIGEGTLIGSGAVIIDNDFHDRLPGGSWGNNARSTSKPIHIGKDVFIGARAMVLKGVSIGDRAVVGAGAVVTKSIPPDAVAAGNPARIINNNAISIKQ